MTKYRLLTLVFLALAQIAHAHNAPEDFFRATGKIHVVFAVILSIFAGLILFLIWMERRVSKIEKQINL